jgi:hypothetical protein
MLEWLTTNYKCVKKEVNYLKIQRERIKSNGMFGTSFPNKKRG